MNRSKLNSRGRGQGVGGRVHYTLYATPYTLSLVLAFCLGGLVLAGCGAAENFSPSHNPAAAPEPPPPVGIYVDSTAEAWLRDRFYAVKACAGMEKGEYEDLTVVLMPPLFPCPYYADGCSGEYVPPGTVKLGSVWMLPHEAVHYLLWRNTGDADAAHKSPLFEQCGK